MNDSDKKPAPTHLGMSELLGTEKPEHPEFKRLLGEAGFSKLLAHPTLAEVGRRYAEKDALAVAEKKRFMHFSKRASLSILIGTIAAALLVASASLNEVSDGASSSPSLTFLRWTLATATIGFGSYSLFCLTFVNRAGLLRHFRAARSRAELERLNYFTQLAGLAPAGTPAALAALDVFHLCQLEGQRAFFSDRIAKSRERYRRTVWIGSIAVVIVAFSGGGFGIAGIFEPQLLPLAGLGAIGAALATYASQLESVNQDERTGERYEQTLDALSKLMESFAEVRRGVAAGAADVFEQFVAAVQEELASEHQEWLEDSKSLDQAVKDLEASLSKLRSPQGADTASPEGEAERT